MDTVSNPGGPEGKKPTYAELVEWVAQQCTFKDGMYRDWYRQEAADLLREGYVPVAYGIRAIENPLVDEARAQKLKTEFGQILHEAQDRFGEEFVRVGVMVSDNPRLPELTRSFDTYLECGGVWVLQDALPTAHPLPPGGG